MASQLSAPARLGMAAAAVIGVGGDVPPELLSDANSWFPRVLVLRGARDDWYTAKKMGQDYRALRPRADHVQMTEYEGGHEWSADVTRAAEEFIAKVVRP